MSAPTLSKHCARCDGEMQEGPGASRVQMARGLCSLCYRSAQRRGTLTDFERASRSRDEVMDDWSVLRSQGFTLRQAAERLGIKFPTFERAYLRARKAGDPRAIPAVQNCTRLPTGSRIRPRSEAA